MKLHPIQDSFAGGEITPKLNARADLEIFKQGLEEMTNMFPLRHGPASRREGTAFIDRVLGNSTGRLFTFGVSPAQNFVVLVDDNSKITIYNENGQILLNNLVTNPSFDAGLTSWTDGSDGGGAISWLNGVAVITSHVVGDDAVLYQSIDTSAAPNGDHEVSIVGLPKTTLSALILNIGTTAEASDIATVTFTEGVSSFTFNPGGSTAVFLSFVLEGVDPLDALWSLDSVTCSALAGGGVVFTHPWDAAAISEMHAEMPPGETVLFFATPRFPQQELIYTPSTETWDFQAITFVDPPAVWTGTNYPATVTFYQGRSWWGGSPNEPETFWASKSSVLRDMTIGSVADDALEFTLSRRGRIEWMEGVKNLLVGTANGEFIITSVNGLIEPGDISVEQQSAYGSENAEARPIGNQVLYVSSDGSKLRELDYSWTEEGWLSRDLTFPAEHLPLADPIIEVHYVQNPESVINCVTRDGQLLACTYDPNSKFVGWSRLETNGRVMSATVTKTRGSSVLWVLVARNIVAPTEFYLENFTEKSQGRDFVDSNVIQVNDPPSAAITGVTHLANQTVRVTVDDATHPDIVLDSNGDGTLNYAGKRIAIGLSYVSRMRTLPMDPGAQTGSGMSMRKRWNRIFTRLLDSALPLVNGERQPDRTPSSPMDITEPDRSQDVESRGLGWDQFAQIEVEQDLARALIVTAIFGEYSEEAL